MSRTQLAYMVAGLSVLTCGCASLKEAVRAKRLMLARDGRSDFVLVVADDASPSTRYAAQELQRFLEEMTGVALPVVSDTGPLGAHEIVLGNNAHLRRLDVAVDFDPLGDEGYIIKTVGPHVVIAGGDLRGNLYGVYGLLEDHLGCRWFTPEVGRIPKHTRLTIPPIDDVQIPVLEYREPFVIDCFDGDWCARNRVNSSSGRLEAKHGGKVRFGAGMFVHTFNGLMPPDKHFAEHPEYFSEVNGQRVKDRTQLCCTNDDVVRICTEEMRKRIQADPEAFVYSLSQNDWGNYCECPRCRALAEAQGSQMAPVLQLVNRVAEALEDEFPDKAIETLAYQWTRKAPKTMRPRPNVIIRLCSIECCFMHPLATCDSPQNTAFRKDAAAWAQVADRLWVWDYVTSFRHFLCPFPNLRVLNDNIRFYIDHNVVGIFEQDNYQSLNGELSPLGGYIIAKYLWNRDYDEDTAINEFLEGVYGKAAKPIRKYIDLLHDKVAKDNLHANIWIGPNEAPYLTSEIMAKSQKYWDRALRAVADEPEALERVQTARLSFEYAWLEQHRSSAFAMDHANFTSRPDPAFVERLRRFIEVARRSNVTRIDESRITLDNYEEGYSDLLEGIEQTYTPVGPVAVDNPEPGLRCEYYESDAEWERLPDFDALTPVRTAVAERIAIGSRDRDDRFGFRFTGCVRVERDGLYAFQIASNDGSRLRIGDALLVDNDGQHGVQEVAGIVALKAGYHPIEVVYFESGGTERLHVTWEGPGFDKTAIPRAALFHAGE